MHLLITLVLIAVVCDAKYSDCDQIEPEDFMRYGRLIMVSVRYDCQQKGDSSTHCCSGIILTESYVVTAAECVDHSTDDITVVAGFHNRSGSDQIIRKIDQITIHPQWTIDRVSVKYNIALLHLSNPLNFTIDRHATRACGAVNLKSPNSTRLVVIQWNSIQRNFDATTYVNLQQNEMILAEKNDPICHRLIDDVEQQFCTRFYRPNSCNYQSGEVMLQLNDNGWMQIGRISSVMRETDGNCLKVYTQLAYYREWIESILKSEDLISMTTVMTATDSPTTVVETYECNKYKVSCGCSIKDVVLSSTRIIGGEEAVPNSWGMAVSIRLNDSVPYSCGGSIVSQFYILTSAHCVENGLPLEISVLAGVHNRIEDFVILRYAHRIYIHPNWNGSDGTYQNDIALLYIFPPLPVDGNDNLARTCLPYTNSLNETINYPSNASHLAVVGWGSTHHYNNDTSATLQQAGVYMLDSNDPVCLEIIHDVEKQFCAGVTRADSCHGDEGSPIFQWKGKYWEQVGITSYGGQCDSIDSPGVFTRLSYYFDWMESVTKISLTTTTPKPPLIYSCNKTSSCGCGKLDAALTSSRIVGGEDAIENSWPMIVSLRLSGTNDHSCGGTIVSNSYILTAAHCLRQVSTENPMGITIAAGMTNRLDPLQIIRNVDRIYIHPNFTGIARDNRHDIALLHLDQPFAFESNANVTKTCIHRIDPPFPTNQHPKNGTPLAVIGWGTLWPGDIYLPEILQQAQVFTIDNEEPACVGSINNTDLQFCAGLFEGGKDSCQGDSGGPIFQWTGQYWEQVGIVSYGNGCARPGFPGIYTRLSYYYHWIEQILERDGEHLEPKVLPYTTTITSDTTDTFETHSDTTGSSLLSSTVSATAEGFFMKSEPNILIFGLSVLLLSIN